ncbi:MAG: ethanolamine ammonia-lyase subunit EutC [Gracilibacteraceae bacterium]|nr:ethanolamine ammonia-lyase subunit EutC [Gracilibacteraceae bacterium]
MTEKIPGEMIPDISEGQARDWFAVPRPADAEGYLRLQAATSARLGVWRAGTRYATQSMLRFRADWAGARDAVNTDVPADFIAACGFLAGSTQCADREVYLRRPDLGRRLSGETRELYAGKLAHDARVLLAVGDGLSSAAICANAADVILTLQQGLALAGIETGPIPFIKYCRVGVMDDLAPLVRAEAVCLLIGERPGLVCAESMSAYMAYRPDPGRPESWRTVVSNIHAGGLPPVEAGAQIAEVMTRILEQKLSGVALEL